MSDAAGIPASSADIAPGRLLAKLRTEHKLSVADVAQRLKYAVRQIEALEAEEFSRLPGTTFVRGMVRGYAKLLEIDPEPLLKSLERRQIPGTATVDLRAKRVPFPDGTKRRGTRTYAVLSLLVLAAVGGVLYEWHSGGLPAGFPRRAPAEVAQAAAPAAEAPAEARPVAAPEKPAAPATAPSREIPKAATALPKAAPAPVSKAATESPKPSPKPTTAQAARPAAAAAATQAPAEPKTVAAASPVVKDVKSVPGPNRIFMEFADDAWVEISDGEGKTLMAQLNPGGSRRVVFGHPPFSVVIGNAAAVRFVYNDRSLDLVPYVKVEVARFTLQ
jgi:cytoskeleton protein RodZ